MKKCILILAALLVVMASTKMSYAFNLISDVEQQATFPIGQAASAGTAVNLRTGKLAASFLAELSNYRMFSFWYGGTYVNSTDNNLTDTAKIGINLGYFLTGFKNQPPLLIRNLVFGPSYAMSLITTPRVGTPFFDFNLRFGGDTSLPKAETPTLAPITN